MFIDTYAVERAFKIENLSFFDDHRYILDYIDAHQGEKRILKIEKSIAVCYRNTLWRCMQVNHSKVIIIDTSYAPQNYKYISEKKLLKELNNYNTFIVNYFTKDFTEAPEFLLLREAIAAGDKLLLYTVP